MNVDVKDLVKISKARAGFTDLCDRALSGRDVVVTKDSVPIVAIISIERFEALQAAESGCIMAPMRPLTEDEMRDFRKRLVDRAPHKGEGGQP